MLLKVAGISFVVVLAFMLLMRVCVGVLVWLLVALYFISIALLTYYLYS